MKIGSIVRVIAASVVAAVGGVPGHVMAASAFPVNYVVSCQAGDQFVDVEVGQKLSNGAGQLVSKRGMVGVRWAGAEPVWSKPMEVSKGVYRFGAPKGKTLVLKVLRTPVQEDDYAPFMEISVVGGKTYRCGYAAE